MKPRLIYCSLFTLLLIITFSTIASAQVTWGLRLMTGQNINYYSGWGQSSINTSSFVGIGGLVTIQLTEGMALQPEINYATYTAFPFEANTLSIPLLLTWKLNKVIIIEAGPSLERDFAFGSRSNYHGLIPSFNLGANTGINFRFNDKWSANLHYRFEVFRTTYATANYYGGDVNDPLLLPEPEGEKPGFRDTYITTSLQYSFR